MRYIIMEVFWNDAIHGVGTRDKACDGLMTKLSRQNFTRFTHYHGYWGKG